MTEAIDSAFTDRADIKMLINSPKEMAIYTILKAAIEELIKVNMIIHLFHCITKLPLEIFRTEIYREVVCFVSLF